jgi:FKBP-type peptidyl-prolyl cis-trans isomerase
MKSIKLINAIALLGAMFFLNGCLDTEEEPVNPQFEQFEKDVAAIDAYLTSNGIDAIADEFTGIRYVVNNPGDGLNPILSVVDSLTLTYEASVLSSGFVFDEADGERFKTTDLLSGIAYTAAFIEEGGSVTAYVPSFYGFGATATDDIPANSIMKIDLGLDAVVDRQLITEINAIDAALEEINRTPTIDPSGIRYFLEQGVGNFADASSIVSVSYEGKLFSNDEVFDSSNDATFQLSNLILGWQIMIPKMKEGAKMTMYIPSPYAYGTGGSRDVVPPNATLVFELELLSIN